MLALDPFGDATGWCTTLKLDNRTSFITDLEIGFDSNGITHIVLMSSAEQLMFFGEQVYSYDARKAKMSFTEED